MTDSPLGYRSSPVLLTAAYADVECIVNVDELATEIGRVSCEQIVQELSALLIDWKSTSVTAEEIRQLVDMYIDNNRIANDEGRIHVDELWSSFRNVAIEGLSGLTMNERLFYFGFFKRFD